MQSISASSLIEELRRSFWVLPGPPYDLLGIAKVDRNRTWAVHRPCRA
jgi:hypothetical protein